MTIRSNLQVESADTIESRLRASWAELLSVEAEEITMHSDFFSLGGNSMLLLSLHIFVTRELRQDLLIPDLIENAVFMRMVELLENGSPTAKYP